MRASRLASWHLPQRLPIELSGSIQQGASLVPHLEEIAAVRFIFIGLPFVGVQFDLPTGTDEQVSLNGFQITINTGIHLFPQVVKEEN
jgi:hypothetical protein